MLPEYWPEEKIEALDFEVEKKEKLTEGAEVANLRTRCKRGAACVPKGKANTAMWVEEFVGMVFFFFPFSFCGMLLSFISYLYWRCVFNTMFSNFLY